MFKLGETVYEYSLEIYLTGKVEKKKESHKIVAITKHEKRGDIIAVEDSCSGFEVYQSINESYATNNVFNKPIVFERKWRSKVLEDSIYGQITCKQSNEDKVYQKLKKEIKKYLEKEYGKYGYYIDLLDKIEI